MAEWSKRFAGMPSGWTDNCAASQDYRQRKHRVFNCSPELAKPTGLLEEVMHEEFEPLQQTFDRWFVRFLAPMHLKFRFGFVP